MTTSGDNRPGPFWTGAAFGVAAAAVVLTALTATFLGTGLPVIVEAVGGAALGALVLLAFLVAIRLAVALVRLAPRRFRYVAAAGLGVSAVVQATRFGWSPSLFYPAAAVFLAAQAALAGAVWALARGDGRRPLMGAVVAAALVVDVLGAAWLESDGYDPYPLAMPVSASLPPPIGTNDPSEPGPYEVERLTYGSGTDRRRPEYGENVTVTAPTVDATKLLPEWTGFKARAREWYWGFSLAQAPLNARVFMPAGDGPFPLTLIVHGNHRMEDYSDAGYDYLGELLASRGFIMASVDENYINGTWSGDFGGREMPLRGWLLLEHLRLWREWNETPGHRFEGKVDFGKVALMGHSRGGEALGIAAAFNRLPFFPDDASVRFDYGFDIRALVSIAQIDKRYIRRPELEDVDFLALQGSYDSDEASFHGLRQFRRTRFTGDDYRFKAGLYIHGGNHGQFNTGWGRYDSGPPGHWLLNVAPMISGEDQRLVAKVYIAAFLEAALAGDLRYIALFKDPRAGREWLPEEIPYLHQFEDSTFLPVARFEEDLDVTTATFPGARIETEGLDVWREQELLYRDELTMGTNGVVLGASGGGASYGIRFDGAPADADPDGALGFLLSLSTETPGGAEPRDSARSSAAAALDLEVEIEDALGATARVAVSEVGPVAPPVRIQFLKLSGLNQDAYTSTWEPSFQSFEIPLSSFAGIAPGAIRALRFRLNGTGVVILDDVGFLGPPGGRAGAGTE